MHYPMDEHSGGAVYTASFSAAALTTNDQDLFFLTAPANSKVAIREIRLGQYTEAGDAEAELLSLTLMRGSTSAAAGSTVTPRNVRGHAGAPIAGTAVSAPSTTLASTDSAALILADAWNVAAGWWFNPPAAERPVIEPAQTMLLRMSAPADAMTMNGTVTFQELGKVPG